MALKGKEQTAEERRTCCQIVRPETILAWFRQLATPAPAIQGWLAGGLAMALGGVGFAGLRLRRESA